MPMPNRPLSDPDLQALAVRHLRDYDAREPGLVFDGCDPMASVDEAYRLQAAVAALRSKRGEHVAGFKIGCVTPSVQQQLGVDRPVTGHVFASEVRLSPASLAEDRYCSLGVEGELAVTLARNLDDPKEVAANPAKFVRYVFPVMELHHCVFRRPDSAAMELIANNALQAGIVVPHVRTTVPMGMLLNLRVVIGGREVGRANVDPYATLAQMASLLCGRGITARAGQCLLTGSPLPLYPVQVGDRFMVEWLGHQRVMATLKTA